jgi:hypothetical protein
MWRIAIVLLVACAEPTKEAFVVDGFVFDPIGTRGSVIGLWELAGSPPKYYKFGDGVRLDSGFTLGFDTDPPAAALNDGLGVAYVVMLPELTTVPDGPVNPAAIGLLGISGDTGVVYKTADATGPPWAAGFAPRFSCAGCQQKQTGKDDFTVIGCVSVSVRGPTAETCAWF